MKLYTRAKSACGLIITLTLLTIGTSAQAMKPDPRATVMRGQQSEMNINETSAATNARLLKVLAGQPAYRGDACGNSAPDPGETCDDGFDEETGLPVGGDGCSADCQIESGWDCTAAIPGSSDENFVNNGDFELGANGDWIETTTGITFGPISSPGNCNGCNLASDQDGGGIGQDFGGEWWVWNGGWSTALTSSVDQDVVIPTTATTLQLDIWEGNCIPDGGTGDFVSVRIDGTEVFNTGVCTTESFYAQANTTIALDGPEAIAACGGTGCADGASHNIEIYGEMDIFTGDPQTGSILIDRVRINAPLENPVPPMASNCRVAVCGDSILSDGELCDDGVDPETGEPVGGDGCDASCQVEDDNWVCLNDEADTMLDVLNGALSSVENIADGGLETGAPNDFWDESGTVFAPICSSLFCGATIANDGDFYAWFGGSDDPNSQTLTQNNVDIGADATALTFQLLVSICDSDQDELRVLIDDQTVWERPCTSETSGYELQTVDLTGDNLTGIDYRNGNHTIQIAGDTLATGGNGNTDTQGNPIFRSNMFVDDISINFGVSPEREANGSVCFQLNEACGLAVPSRGIAPGFGIEQFENGGNGNLGVMTTVELGGSLFGDVDWTTTDDQWTTVGDLSGCGTEDLSVANWSGGNRTGGTGLAACIDADGGAESLAMPDAGAACISTNQNPIDPVPTCQTRAYLCTPGIDTTNMTNPSVTATVHYQTATQDGDTDYDGDGDPFDDDELFEVLVGDSPPSAISFVNYVSAGAILDHNTNTLARTGSTTIGVGLDNFRNPAATDPEDALDAASMYVCFHYAGIYSWYAQVDNVGSRASNCLVGDADFDLVSDDVDNCTNVDNPDQVDSNGDGYGNACDADINNDCQINFADLQLLSQNFFASAETFPDFDLNGDGGVINFGDLQVLSAAFFQPPGPGVGDCPAPTRKR